jgi:hypothetical protein
LGPSGTRPLRKPPDIPFSFFSAQKTTDKLQIQTKVDESQITANLPLPPRCNPMTTPEVPNPWEQPRSLGNQELKWKARQEAILDETKKQLNKILGEYNNPPFPSLTFKRGIHDNPPVSTFNWPNDPIKQI